MKNLFIILSLVVSASAFAGSKLSRRDKVIIRNEARSLCAGYVGQHILKNHYQHQAEVEIFNTLKDKDRRILATSEVLDRPERNMVFAPKLDETLLNSFLGHLNTIKRSKKNSTIDKAQIQMASDVRSILKKFKPHFWKDCYSVQVKKAAQCFRLKEGRYKERCLTLTANQHKKLRKHFRLFQ